MKCKFCGKNIKKNSEICTCCGKNVNEEPGTDDLIDAMPEIRDEFDKISKLQAQDKKKKEKKQKRAEHKKRRTVIAVILVIAILGGIAGGMIWWNKRSKDAENKKAEEEKQAAQTSAIECAIEKLFVGSGFTEDIITDAASAKNAINSAKGSFSIKDVDKEYELKSEMEIGGSKIYRFQQMYEGIPVYDGEMVIMADPEGVASAFNGIYIKTEGLTTEYKVDEGEASAKITEYVNSLSDDYAVVEGISISAIEKSVCHYDGCAYLAYMANVSGYNSKSEFVAYDVFIDGVSGIGICALPTSSFEKEATVTEDDMAESYIYEMVTASDKFNWNDETVTSAREPLDIGEIESGNASAFVSSVKTATDNAYNYFASTFGWKGLDGKGTNFKVFINSNEYVEENLPREKAMYANGQLMFFREDLTQGDIDYNTVVHEYAHGVMANIAGFCGTIRCNENAAIAEGLADVFAELAEAKLKGTAPDWVHGERILHTPEQNYHISTSEAAEIANVQECYEYSTIVSHMAAFMGNYVSDISVQNEFWFKTMCLMTKGTDFTEFGSIIEAVTMNMYSEGKLDEMQYSSIMTGIEMLGASEQDLYSIEE